MIISRVVLDIKKYNIALENITIYSILQTLFIYIFQIMKKTFIMLILPSLLILWGCGYNNTTRTPATGDTNTAILTGDDVQAPLVDQLSGDNNSYTLFFDDNNTSKTFTIHHQADEDDFVYFINDGFTKLTVNIFFLSATEFSPNLRLAQIIMPDGTMDWPFGTETTYDLTQNGWYQLRFHENMMAGDPWTGDATITISVSK